MRLYTIVFRWQRNCSGSYPAQLTLTSSAIRIYIYGTRTQRVRVFREFLDKRGLTDYEEGDLGPVY
eukprot:293858-Amorphochlora_amoeboformis.AAC.1